MLIGILVSACNPNKDIYDAISNTEKPYSEKIDIELTDADYAAIKSIALAKATTQEEIDIATDLGNFKSFSTRRSAANLIPDFIANNYVALDSASSVNVKYKFSVNDYDSISFYELSDNDYISFGGAVGDSLAFFQEQLPQNYLPDFLTDTVSNYLTLIKCKFIEQKTENILTNVTLIDTVLIPNDTLIVQNDTIFTNYDTTFVEINTEVLLPHTYYERKDTSIVYTKTDDNWAIPDNSYVFNVQDYNSVGISGNYLNFSSSKNPDHYMPTFLKNKFPYAKEKDIKLVSYMFYGGSSIGTFPMTTGYKFNGSEWVSSTDMISQFIHTGSKWIFDPTIDYTISKTDYQLIVDYIVNHETLSVYKDPNYDNTEYYYGASSHYGNFDMRVYKRKANDPLNYLEGMSDDEISVEIFNRLKEAVVIFAEIKFPAQEPIENGTQVYYNITYHTYEPGHHYYKMKIKCTSTGKFEYFSGPEEI